MATALPAIAAVAAIGSSVYTIAKASSTPPIPQLKPLTDPLADQKAEEAAAAKGMQDAGMSQARRASTLLSGGGGVMGDSSSYLSRRTLLGN